MSDAQILLTSNEGWGLTLTEAMLTGNPIIANVTGGMQDQMRFVDENGNGLYLPQKYLLIIQENIKNMVNGHFLFILLVDQFKVLLLLLIFGMIDVNQKMQQIELEKYIIS